MGNHVSAVPTQLYSVEDYFSDLSEYEFVEKMGSTRFLKIARARYRGSYVVVKVFPRVDKNLLQSYQEKLNNINTKLSGCAGTLAFPKALITDRSGILIRQYVWSNLYDRINLRPFLCQTEKLWIVFQMLMSLNECHSRNVVHGDLKTENFLLTSWNWVLLTDFACYKPVELLEDNPAAYSFFYDTSRRRKCYIAPERFKLQLSSVSPPLGPSMDIFSLGCVIAELYLEGAQLFNLHQLISFRDGGFSPDKSIDMIENKGIRDLIKSMLSLNPENRQSAAEYIDEELGSLFPSYFSFLYSFLKIFCSPLFSSSDKKISFLHQNMATILEKLQSNDKENGHIIILSLVTSCIRGIQQNSGKAQALQMFEVLSGLVPDELVTDRVIPHVLYFTQDQSPSIRANSIVSLTKCLACVSSLATTDSNIFPEYIFPLVNKLSTDPQKLVQRVFAEHIGSLAEYALSLLETSAPASFDAELLALHNIVQIPVVQILTGDDNIARRILLEKCITSLCVFFGQQKANDLILSHLITFLNYKNDWRLRAAFFDCVVGVVSFVGWHSLNMLKPLLQQGLTDVEEFVVSKTLSALTSLSDLGLLEESLLKELVLETAPLLCHPNLWVRYRTVGFISAACKKLHVADIYCKILPCLHQVIAIPIRNPENERILIQALDKPLPRHVIEFLIGSQYNEKAITCLLRNTVELDTTPAEVKQTVNKLRNLGMGPEQEGQVVLLRDYILKVSIGKRSTHEDDLFEDLVDGAIIVKEDKLKSLNFLDSEINSAPTKPQLAKQVSSVSISGIKITAVPDVKLSISSLNDSTLQGEISHDPLFKDIEGIIDMKPLTEPGEKDQLDSLLTRKQDEYLQQSRTERQVAAPPKAWFPKGVLVCHINEHKAAVNQVKVAPKYAILATSSDDGCVKIWNTKKFDSRNIVNNSRHTYSRPNQPIRGMAFYDTGDKIAVATRNGSLHEVGVKELKVCAARTLAIHDNDVVVDMDTLGAGRDQNLVVCTNDGKIIGVDLRSPCRIFKLSNRPSLGGVSAMCIDRNEHWVCLGTRAGWMTCWDLRFHLPITSWQHETGAPVIRLTPAFGSMSQICVGVKGYNEVSVWNIESACKEKSLWFGPPGSYMTHDPNTGVHAILPLTHDTIITGNSDSTVRAWNTNRESGCSVISAPKDATQNITYTKRYEEELKVTSAEEDHSLAITHNPQLNGGMPSAATSHRHVVSDVAFVNTTQPCLVTADMGGVMKIWK